MAFTLRERQLLGIQGLLPPCVITPEQQMKRVMANFHRWTNDLDKYIYLMSLQVCNYNGAGNLPVTYSVRTSPATNSGKVWLGS